MKVSHKKMCDNSRYFWYSCVVFFTDQGLVDWSGRKERGKRRQRERAVSLMLLGKSIKPIHRTFTSHEGTGHPLKEVLKAWARKWAQQVSMLRQEWRQKGYRGPQSLVEQGYFISRNAGLYIFSKMIRRRQWHPTPVLLPGKSHGQRSLVGCSPWGH